MKFYVGLHQPSDARHFGRCMVSVKRLLRRKSDFQVGEWMMDSGAFTELKDHGRYRHSPEEYAAQVARWSRCGDMVAAVSQDFMCESLILGQTGLTVPEHQRLTVERYDAIRECVGDSAYVMPVLQGYWPDEYLACAERYGDRLKPGMWVGVGSVCKRNADVEEIEQVLVTIHRARPDLLLHGFGVKLTALESSLVRDCLHSADSMAWSRAARWEGRDRNSWREAAAFAARTCWRCRQAALACANERAELRSLVEEIAEEFNKARSPAYRMVANMIRARKAEIAKRYEVKP